MLMEVIFLMLTFGFLECCDIISPLLGGALPHSYPDNHLGQLDVNELFAKLLSTGILKLSKTDSTSAQANETSAQPAAEEEDDDQGDHDVPDLTNFKVEELRQCVL